MTIGEFVKYFEEELAPLQWYDKREVKSMASYLLKEIAGVPSYKLIVEPQMELAADCVAALVECTCKMKRGEPLQYTLGYEYFCGHKFNVAPGVLIPRPETEELVNMIFADRFSSNHVPECGSVSAQSNDGLKILDICTGSGCIAWSLAAGLPDSLVWGCDISDAALNIARAQKISSVSSHTNTSLHSGFNLDDNVSNVSFFKCDILAPSAQEIIIKASIQDSKKEFRPNSQNSKEADFTPFDIIVSNPPYVCEQERKEMRANVLDHEPELALFVPDEDPLKFYRRIVELASGYTFGKVNSTEVHDTEVQIDCNCKEEKRENLSGRKDRLLRRGGLLSRGGRLYFEVNERFAAEVAELMQVAGFSECTVVKDMFGKERMVKGTLC